MLKALPITIINSHSNSMQERVTIAALILQKGTAGGAGLAPWLASETLAFGRVPKLLIDKATLPT